MRVIYLHQYFNTPRMSGGTRSYELARRLVAHGHEVHMVTSNRSGIGRGWVETEEAGIRVHWCPVAYRQGMGFYRRLQSFLDFSWRSALKAQSLPGDVLFATSTPLTIALPAVWASRRKGIPMVFEVRDLWPEMPIGMGILRSPVTIAAARWLERFAYRNARRIVALSSGMKDGIAATGYPADRVTVVPNCCDVQQFSVSDEVGREFRRRQKWLGDRPLVVYTGAIGRANGVDYLARLAAVVGKTHPEIRFLVLGSGGEEGRIRRLAGELGVLDRSFFMLPPIPKREMPAVLSAADLVTVLLVDVKEIWTNSPNKAFDGLAAGRPLAVNSFHGWLGKTIQEHQCGVILDPRDLQTAASTLTAAVGNPSWTARARVSARRLARERFDRDKLAALWESVVVGTTPAKRLRRAA